MHRGKAGAPLHEAVEVERDPVAWCADLDAGDFIVVTHFVVVDL